MIDNCFNFNTVDNNSGGVDLKKLGSKVINQFEKQLTEREKYNAKIAKSGAKIQQMPLQSIFNSASNWHRFEFNKPKGGNQ